MPKQNPMWWKLKKADHFYYEFCEELKIHKEIQLLAFESFKTNFRDDVMELAKEIYA